MYFETFTFGYRVHLRFRDAGKSINLMRSAARTGNPILKGIEVMVVNDWQAHCWRWLRARFAPAASQGRKLRRQRANPVSVVAAQVEQLESRQLLTVTYHGGALLTAVSAQAVYLGSDWQNTSTLQTQKGQLDQFVSTIVQSPYMDMLTNAGYNVGRGTSTAGAIDNLALNKTSGITDGQIRADLQAMITAGQVQAPGANNLYVIYVEPGVVINTSFGASNTAFLGYHGAFAGHTASGAAADIHYAIIAYPGAPNFSASSQGFASNLDDLTAVSSHEIAEAITDPNVNYKALGWYDDQLNGEIGDLAVGHYATLSGFLVQDMVNQRDQIMTPGMTQPPPPPPSGPTAPVVTAHAVNSTTANLSWGAVTGIQGYKVFQVVGSQKVLLGSVSSTVTSVNVTGLAAGSTDTFVIEAYSSTTTADSNAVSVTLPAPPPPQSLASPQLSAKATSSTTAQLTWTAVPGAQGYRIFWSNGSQTLYLGYVMSGTTSVKIINLPPGSTSKFQIQAYNGSAVGNSAWVSVTTPAARIADPVTVLAGLAGHHSKHDNGWIVA